MHRRLAAPLLVIALASAPLALSDEPATKHTVYDFSLVDINGKTVPLSIYKGKILLIVNLASQSTYRDQIAALNDLEKNYAAEGLVVIGIPSSDFGDKELKDAAALREYYNNTAHVGFPLFAPAIRWYCWLPFDEYVLPELQDIDFSPLRMASRSRSCSATPHSKKAVSSTL